MISYFAFLTAICKGVELQLFLALTLAPCSINFKTNGKHPRAHAMCNGVSPDTFFYSYFCLFHFFFEKKCLIYFFVIRLRQCN